MPRYIPGQRVISDAELQNGLGTVMSVDGRTLEVHYEASGETRTYAEQTAPLTRVVFAVGDSVMRQDGRAIRVSAISEQDGLLVYQGTLDGEPVELPEAELDSSMQLNRASERLLNGQIDAQNWFELRYQTREHLERLARSDLYGLLGARTSLLPHQLYIAHEVGTRFAPRVLLADEVGLGKTIEAGLILHQQLLTERARRVLIILPETLLHQWLVEMLRRFNLHFRIFDEDRWQDLLDEDPTANPFLSEQLVMCSLEFLLADEAVLERCQAGEWDLMVVDEAHHLEWSEDAPGRDYRLIESLAQITPGVLLLTATPEQLGKESHFARLRLLDPSRFHDYEAFIDEEQSYAPVAAVLEKLIEGSALQADEIDLIAKTFGEADDIALLDSIRDASDDSASEDARADLVEHLLDRHGTGRVLFRNTRAAVKGFPNREVIPVPLPLPEEYSCAYENPHSDRTEELLSLEALCAEEAWSDFDPRISWLQAELERLYPAKALIITARADTALEIARVLRTVSGIHAAVFHEGLSIVDRDKAAAWFAEQPNGAQVLVCSEIGSEGRNFQFAHHLILFDLPQNPDLLEQRIGRLDRIGQTETINIHVPYLQDSPQEVMFRWYHEALEAFSTTCPAGYSVYTACQHELLSALRTGRASDALIENSRSLTRRLHEEMQRGRDRLLEYNSCRSTLAEGLRERALQMDETDELAPYMDKVFDCFGVDSELHSQDCLIIRPGEHMTQPFPRLNDDGMTVTFDRHTALTFEDAHYLSWEHPMVTDAMDMVIMLGSGNTAVTAIRSKALPAGSLLLECVYMLEVADIDALQSWRYLPPSRIRVVIDQAGKDYAERLPHANINRVALPVETKTGIQVVRAKRAQLKQMLDRSAGLAEQRVESLLGEAHRNAAQVLRRETDRLKALSAVNPNVRQDEIEHYESQLDALATVIDSAALRLDAVRVIVVT